jgi:hypothetical protein
VLYIFIAHEKLYGSVPKRLGKLIFQEIYDFKPVYLLKCVL